MMNEDVQAFGQLLHLPIGELFRSLALGLADAQAKLDESAINVAEFMSGSRTEPGGETIDSRVYFGYHMEKGDDDNVKRVPDKVSMLELGFVPNFYQFVDTVIEVRVAVTVARVKRSESAPGGKGRGASAHPKHTLTMTPVNASYSSAYSFDASFASVVKTKLVPIPPPALLEDRIRKMVELGTPDPQARTDDDAANDTDANQPETDH